MASPLHFLPSKEADLVPPVSQNEMKRFSLVFINLIILFASVSHAAINRRGISDQLIADFYAVKSHETPMDVQQVIPLDMQASGDANYVLSRLADRGITSWVTSDAFKNSQLGRTTAEVQETMQADISVKGSESNSIEHKFNLNFQVFQAVAQLKYTGLTNLLIRYKATAAELNFEISEKLDESKDIVFDHLAHSDYQNSQVSVRWTF